MNVSRKSLSHWIAAAGWAILALGAVGPAVAAVGGAQGKFTDFSRLDWSFDLSEPAENLPGHFDNGPVPGDEAAYATLEELEAREASSTCYDDFDPFGDDLPVAENPAPTAPEPFIDYEMLCAEDAYLQIVAIKAEHEAAEAAEAALAARRALVQESGIELFGLAPADLLTTDDHELLRDLESLPDEACQRRAAVEGYLESLGDEAWALAAHFEQRTGIEVFDLADDIPGVAAYLGVYRLLERGELGVYESVDLLRRTVNNLTVAWIDGVQSLTAEARVPGPLNHVPAPWDEESMPAEVGVVEADAEGTDACPYDIGEFDIDDLAADEQLPPLAPALEEDEAELDIAELFAEFDDAVTDVPNVFGVLQSAAGSSVEGMVDAIRGMTQRLTEVDWTAVLTRAVARAASLTSPKRGGNR